MKRPLFLVTCIVALTFPLRAAAQSAKEPARTKELKDAEKFYTSAQLTQDSAERKSRLERALNPVQQAIVKDGGNARVWLMAGQVYSALHDYARADSAFDKAEQLYPPLADEVTPERMHAWADLFTVGVNAMDAGKYDDAIAALETADAIYNLRPESKINLGALYSNKADLPKAEAAFRAAVAITDSPARNSVKAEEAPLWKRYHDIGTINAAAMVGQRGVIAFDGRRLDEAADLFAQARALNPHARDYTYNLAQTLYAQTSQLEKDRTQLLADEKAARTKKDAATADAKAADAKRVSAQIDANYARIEPLVSAARLSDPNNEDLFLLLMRSFQMRSNVTADAAAKTVFQKRGDELLKLHETMAIELTTISVTGNSPEVTVRGNVRNIKVAPGSPIKIRMTFVGLDGTSIGEEVISINAPAKDATTPFEAKAKVSAEVAGWRYTVE